MQLAVQKLFQFNYIWKADVKTNVTLKEMRGVVPEFYLSIAEAHTPSSSASLHR